MNDVKLIAMKILLRTALLVLLFLMGAQAARAQCAPDPGVTDPEGNGEMVPDTLEAWEGQAANINLTVICPTSITYNTNTIPIHHITIKSISNKPAWIDYFCHQTSCEYLAGALDCAQVMGTPPAGSAGTIAMPVLVDVYMDYLGSPVLLVSDYDSGMPLVLIVHPAANVNEIGNTGFGVIPAQPNPFSNQTRLGAYTDGVRSVSLTVVDMVGNIVHTENMITNPGDNFFTFSGNDIRDGIYFCTIQDDRGHVATRKIMKMR